MSCGCKVYEDGDPAYFWSEGEVARTRKPHQCYECGAAIPLGSPACHVTWKHDASDDALQTNYRCRTCAFLAEYLGNLNGACPLWGGLQESACEAGIDFRVYHETGSISKAREACND